VILHMISDRRRLSIGSGGDLVQALERQATHAIEDRVDFIQIRERDLDARPLAALVRALARRARGSPTRIVVNDRFDIAMAAGAAGVHLRSDSIAARDVRGMAPPEFVVGQSVHSVGEAVAAAPFVDYLIAGTVWPTPSKPADHPLIGLSGLSEIVRAVTVPVLAIGGVTLERRDDLERAGAAGFAAIGYFVETYGRASANI